MTRLRLFSEGSHRPRNATYLFVASMDVDAEKAALFHEVYEGCDYHPTKTYAQAHIVDVYGLIPVCHETKRFLRLSPSAY